MALHAFTMTLATIPVASVVDAQVPVPHLQELLDRGFKVVAEGRMLRAVECHRFTLRVLPEQSPDSCETKYGSFKRVKEGDEEFVCVSFPDWSCHRTLN